MVLVCHKCGSEDVMQVRENENTIVYKCKECEHVWVKVKAGRYKWQSITSN